MYVYRFAGEDISLAEAELEGFLSSQNIDEVPEVRDSLAVTETEPSCLERLALVHEVGEVLRISRDLEIDYRPDSSFEIRTGKNVDRDIERKVGTRLETEDNSVDLENPEETIMIYRFGDEYCVSRTVKEIDRSLFHGRKNQERSFSSPISLSPVLARAMVNISGISAGDSILDPFCGTGGMLIEAGLCGIKPFGMDIQKEMVEGTRENLESYGILNHKIKQGEISEIEKVFDQNFDAVVTDLPYDRSSKTEGKPVERFLEAAPELTEGKVVFMSDREGIMGMNPEHEIYIHSNLTRYIYVM